MKRMWQRTFNGLAKLSLLLLIAVVCLWVRSYMMRDALTRDHTWIANTGGRTVWHWSYYSFCFEAGGVDVYTNHGYREGYDGPSTPPRWDWAYGAAAPRRFALLISKRQLALLELERSATPQNSFHQVKHSQGISFLLLVILLALTPLVQLIRRLRHRCTKLGLCPTCRYDLRATPDRCPECGTVPPAKASPVPAGECRTHLREPSDTPQ